MLPTRRRENTRTAVRASRAWEAAAATEESGDDGEGEEAGEAAAAEAAVGHEVVGFHGLKIRVSAGMLRPRESSGALVDAALDEVRFRMLG